MKIVLIGSGNVGTAFGHAFQSKKHRIIQVYSRSQDHASQLGSALSCPSTTKVQHIAKGADLYFVCLTDAASEKFIKQFDPGDSLIVHCSGSIDMAHFNSKAKNCGVMYPMYSFTRKAKAKMSDVAFFTEGNSKKSAALIYKVARSFSKHVIQVKSRQRLAIHTSAVFANNFTNHLLSVAYDILKKEKLPFSIFYPMLERTFSGIKGKDPADTQTGPAKRKDRITMQKHERFLSDQKEVLEMYKMLSASIQRKYK